MRFKIKPRLFLETLAKTKDAFVMLLMHENSDELPMHIFCLQVFNMDRLLSPFY